MPSVTTLDFKTSISETDNNLVVGKYLIKSDSISPPNFKIIGVDADLFYVSDVTYELGYYIPFSLALVPGTATIVVSLKEKANYEYKPSYQFSIESSDLINTSKPNLFELKIINVIEAPEFTSAADITIAENLPLGKVIHTATARADTTRSLTGFSLSPNDYLSINSVSGEIKVAGPIDYEKIKEITIIVTAKDSFGIESIQELNIQIANVNEAPNNIYLSNSQIMENQMGGIIGLLNGTDPDIGDKITFKTSDSRFEIVNSNQLKLKSDVALDHEWTPSTQVAVTATDSKGLSYTESLILSVDNVAGDAPAFDVLGKTLLITEREMGLAVTTALALPEVGHHLSYSLVRGNEFFQIDKDSGLITISGAALTASQYQITVQAFDTDSGLSAIQDLTLDVVSITLSNDHIKENTASVKVGVLALLGLDSGGAYSFTVDDPRFEVTSANELKLRLGQSLDFENSSSVPVKITFTTSTGGGVGQIEVKVDNVNEAPTEILLSNNHVAEKASGAVIGAVTVLDPDLGDTHTLTVSDSRFELRGNLLALKAGQALDFESTPTITLKLTATDLAGLSKQQSLILSVDDVNDPAVITGNKTLTYTEEGNAIQIKSSNLNASDADKTPSFLLTFKVVIDEGQGNPQSGYFYRGSDPSTAIDSFTLADVTSTVASSKIFFKPGTSSVKPVISAIVNDGSVDSAPVDLIVKMTAKNDAATFSVGNFVITEGGSLLLDASHLNAWDEDSTDAQLVFTVSGTLAGGFTKAGSSSAITSFNLADVKAGLITYTHNGSETAPILNFALKDANLATYTAKQAAVAFASVNDAAIVSGSKTLSYTEEGAAVKITSTILNATDAEGAATDAALSFSVSGEAGNGLNGYFYQGIAVNSPISTFTLADVKSTDATKMVYFKPGSGSVPPAIAISVSDGSVDSSPVDLIVKMTAKNDAATFSVGNFAITESGSLLLDTSHLNAWDEDSTDAQLVFTVSGTLAGVFTKAGSSSAITSFNLADVKAGLITYTHNGSETAPILNFALKDANLATYTAKQAAVAFASVNDAAIVSGSKTLSYTEEGAAIKITSTILSATDSEAASDASLRFLVSGAAANAVNGYFYQGTATNSPVSSFTLADVKSTDATKMVYFKPGSGSVPPAITISVSDGIDNSSPVDLIVKMTAKNDSAAIAVAKMPFSPSGSFRLTTDLIDAIDEDSSDAQLRFTASGTLAGSFKITGSSTTSTSFSLADVKAGLVEYTHNGSSSIPTITFKLTDANGSIVTMRSADSTGWGKSYVGTAGADNIIGTNGNDSFTQVGALDTFAGMDGNDSFAVDHLNISLIDGGTGYDTLRLNLDMDFTILADDKLRFIEELNLNGHYCRMELNDVIAMTDSKNILKITGQSSSTLKIDQNWNFIEASEGFSIYTQGAATLYVGSDITIG